MFARLVAAIEQSNLTNARASLEALLVDPQINPWAVHEALFPVVHRVVNPPFINPHLAKMYAINRELFAYLEPEDVASLLRVEVEEFTRRDKLPFVNRPVSIPSITSFTDVELEITKKDVSGTASAMAAFLKAEGPAQLAKRLLLLGSAFIDHSLGHSVSCTAFILLEMLNRKNDDPWPVLVLLADYFCKGSFQQTSKLQYSALSDYREAYLTEVRRAVSGSGVVALHHTITLFAIERSRRFFDPQEYDHILTMWMRMLADKQENLFSFDELTTKMLPDYPNFFTVFSKYESMPVLYMAGGALSSKNDRTRLGCYLIKGVLQCYNGRYDPHFLTGLGSSLWMIESFYDQPTIVMNALLQYLDYFFSGIS